MSALQEYSSHIFTTLGSSSYIYKPTCTLTFNVPLVQVDEEALAIYIDLDPFSKGERTSIVHEADIIFDIDERNRRVVGIEILLRRPSEDAKVEKLRELLRSIGDQVLKFFSTQQSL
ncbi:MAG: DUF2283 domain-containing protein [Crenarchaeota archaeon]|nr:DUF2283 domain-containing protein [Thermoproteota archaeon]